jgi:hypothetical protein
MTSRAITGQMETGIIVMPLTQDMLTEEDLTLITIIEFPQLRMREREVGEGTIVGH